MECPYCDGKCGTHAQCVKCGKGNKKMKFTEEQIKYIISCIDNAGIELYKSEWKAIEEELRKEN